MPKLPGRETSRKQYPIEELLIGSFIMQHEERYWRRPCCVQGCDHRMGPDTTQPNWIEWKSCNGDHLPAFVARDTPEFPSAGMACPCHVAVILERDDTP